MSLRVWLHEGHDGEPGVEAWVPELLGFSTWAPSEREVLARLPAKLEEHLAWRRRHGAETPAAGAARAAGGLEVAGRVHGGEVLLPPDGEPASPAEVDLAIRLLACSRRDLLAELEGATDALLDWDPPYRRFAPWADWRTIRATLAHVANSETHYYLRNIGYETAAPAATPTADWRGMLAASRREALGHLRALRAATDLVRLRTLDHGYGPEAWSARKALRRIVRHELMHCKSIRRIRHAYAEQAPR
jgi:hypothetical protein